MNVIGKHEASAWTNAQIHVFYRDILRMKERERELLDGKKKQNEGNAVDYVSFSHSIHTNP